MNVLNRDTGVVTSVTDAMWVSELSKQKSQSGEGPRFVRLDEPAPAPAVQPAPKPKATTTGRKRSTRKSA